MPANVGGQTISLKFKAPGNSDEINRRFLNTHPVGIYSGGILTVSDGSHANISPLVCEIGDGTYQVRIATTLTVNLSVASGTPYIILRWGYTGDTQDYMELLAVASGSVLANDLVIGKCVFTAGSLSGFDYGGSTTLHRSVPSVHDLYLKVVPTVGSTLKALVLPGWIHGQQNSHFVPMQETSALVPPVSNPKIYLVILVEDGTITIDSTGIEAADPVEPNHNGRLVLAQIRLSPGDSAITASKITDVRTFVTQHPPNPDGVTIEETAAGNLKTRDPIYNMSRTIGGQLANLPSWTVVSAQGTVKYSGINPVVAGVYTLPANRLYKLSYSVVFTALSGTPVFEARWRVTSGDVSWWFADDEYNQSMQKHEATDLNAQVTLAGTFLFLPASQSTVQLEVKTRDAFGQYGWVTYATTNIWAE